MEELEHSPFEDHSVLVLEESDVLAELFETWLSEASPRSVSTLDDLDRCVDSSVAVACLSRSLLGDREEEVRKRLLGTNPYCQLILVLPRTTAFTSPFEAQYDSCLVRPVFKTELQSTVEERLKCSVYSALLREFYHLNAKLVWRERADTSGESEADLDWERVQNRYRDVRNRLHWVQRRLDIEVIYEIMRSLDLHKRYLREPVRDEEPTKQSKHHPPRCPQCKLAWGLDHGNELKAGCQRVGAHVWKCIGCDTIVHGLGESHRTVAPN